MWLSGDKSVLHSRKSPARNCREQVIVILGLERTTVDLILSEERSCLQ